MYIHVIDLNDNAPRFVLAAYQKIVSENVSVDTTILRVTATDSDSGTNGQVHYSIASGGITNNTFELDDQGVLRVRQKLTTQDTNLFNLTIYATDSGIPPKVSKPAFIFVKVERSVLPCKAKLGFPLAAYLAEVNESASIDTKILYVSAKSGNCGYRGKINYLFTDPKDPEVENHFQIISDTGAIKLIRPLDYEVRDRYMLHVAAVALGK